MEEGYGKYSSTKSGFEVMFNDKAKVTCDFLDEKFLKLDKKAAEDSIKKWYDSENARLQFENYSITQKRANAALIISIVAIAASILIAIFKR